VGFIGYLAHLFRILLAAVTMLLLALILWLLAGPTSTILGVQSPTFVLVSVGLIAAIAFATGGYVSARYITPRSWLHPVLASVIMSLFYLTMFSSGNVGALDFGIPLIAAVFDRRRRRARPTHVAFEKFARRITPCQLATCRADGLDSARSVRSTICSNRRFAARRCIPMN
jgi:hypothetical protein